MVKINRLKVVLVEKEKSGKWLADQLGKSTCTVSKWCLYDLMSMSCSFVVYRVKHYYIYLLYSRSTSSTVRPVYLAISSTGIPSAFILRAVSAFSKERPCSNPSFKPSYFPSS